MLEGKAHRTITPSVFACTTIPQHYIDRRKIIEGHNDVLKTEESKALSRQLRGALTLLVFIKKQVQIGLWVATSVYDPRLALKTLHRYNLHIFNKLSALSNCKQVKHLKLKRLRISETPTVLVEMPNHPDNLLPKISPSTSSKLLKEIYRQKFSLLIVLLQPTNDPIERDEAKAKQREIHTRNMKFHCTLSKENTMPKT